jgi:hypothetical protein
VVLATAAASSASAVTIGQVSPVADEGCLGGYDWVQGATVGSLSYAVPSGGKAITSWSTKAGPTAGKTMEFKVFRPTGAHGGYTVVGHDGPRNLTVDSTNTFPVNIPVKPGDLLGLHNPTTGACNSNGLSGDTDEAAFGDLADGASGMFNPDERQRLNVSAVVTTTGGGSAAALKKCKKKHGKKRKKCLKKAKRLRI